MGIRNQIEVISFDIFQTLVDVNKRVPEIWRGILKEKYAAEKALEGARAILDCFPAVYKKSTTEGQFYTMQEVYEECAELAIERLKHSTLDYGILSPEVVARELMIQHAYAPFFDDVLPAMKKLANKYRIIICSDSNHMMVDRLLDQMNYDAVYISDDLRFYKGDLQGGFFKKVLEKEKVDAKRIVHIGDSSADIIGAKNAGIRSCLINRSGENISKTISADWVITNFNELTVFENLGSTKKGRIS